MPSLVAALFLAAVSLVPAFAASVAGPQGSDIPVTADGFLACPAVAMGADGDFEVVWSHYYSDSHPIPQGIFARHFDRLGRPTQAKEIRLDSPNNVESNLVRVVALPGSGYFVSWFEYRLPQGAAMVGRFLNPAGRATSPVLLLARNASPVALAVVNDSLLVAWEEGSFKRSFRVRRYDFEGHALGKAMLLTANAGPGVLDLAPLSDGFVATWQRLVAGSWIIVAQRFSLSGEPLGSAVRVNESRLENTFGVTRLASNGNDRFAVTWTTTVQRLDPQSGQPIADDETRARLFDASGASGPETHPNQLQTGNQQASDLAMNSKGVALVTWSSDRNYVATSLDVTGRFLDPAGQPVSKAFPLAQHLAGTDFCPAAATNGGNEWVIAWLKQSSGIFARRLLFEGE
jgi:hypothetical protein